MHIFGIDELTGLISVPPTILRPAPSTPHLQPVGAGAGVGLVGVVVDGVGVGVIGVGVDGVGVDGVVVVGVVGVVGATVVVGPPPPVIIGVVVFIEISPP